MFLIYKKNYWQGEGLPCKQSESIVDVKFYIEETNQNQNEVNHLSFVILIINVLKKSS